MSFHIIDISSNNASGEQSIRIPDNLRINDDKVFLKKTGNVLYVIPYHNPWESLYKSLDDFTPDFMNERDQGYSQPRESID